MLSQWECLLKNLGQWQGSFTRLSPQGDFIEDTPTLVSLEGINNNKSIRQLVRRLYSDRVPEDLILEYSSLNQGILFSQTGAFSQGALYFSSFSSQFGAEFGLISGERRLRMVQLFNDQGEFDRLTLIREKLADSQNPERPMLTVEQLLGQWQGEAVTTGRDFYNSPAYSTHLLIERQGDNYLSQTLTFGDNQVITSRARIEGQRLLFENSPLPIQILLLPDGASCNTPLKITAGHRFVLEVGWLLSSTQRQRLIRSYNEKGEWTSITLVTEEKIN
jgi:Domain of unknown function (DUF3598)